MVTNRFREVSNLQRPTYERAVACRQHKRVLTSSPGAVDTCGILRGRLCGALRQLPLGLDGESSRQNACGGGSGQAGEISRCGGCRGTRRHISHAHDPRRDRDRGGTHCEWSRATTGRRTSTGRALNLDFSFEIIGRAPHKQRIHIAVLPGVFMKTELKHQLWEHTYMYMYGIADILGSS